MADLVPINEIFGPTIQGEGVMIGCPTIFVRTQGCDFSCQWCDTKYALPRIAPEMKRLTVEQIVDTIEDIRRGVSWVTLSGGNPLIHDLGPLIRELHQTDMLVAVETQGSIYKVWVEECDTVVVSPKPPSSGIPFTESMWHTLDKFLALPVSCLKIVVSTEEDLEFVRGLSRKYEDTPISVQPCNTVGEDTTESLLEKLRWLTDKIVNDQELGEHVVILPQLHVLMYGNKRGV